MRLFSAVLIAALPCLNLVAAPCPNPGLSDLNDSDNFINYSSPSAIKIFGEQGRRLKPLGSGAVISVEGHVLTAGHIFKSIKDQDFSILVRHEPRSGNAFESKANLVVMETGSELDYALLKIRETLPRTITPIRLALELEGQNSVRFIGYKLDNNTIQLSGLGMLSQEYQTSFTATGLAAFHGFSGAMGMGSTGRGLGILAGRYVLDSTGELSWTEVDDHDNGSLHFSKLEAVFDDLLSKNPDEIQSIRANYIGRIARRGSAGDQQLLDELEDMDLLNPLALVVLIYELENDQGKFSNRLIPPLIQVAFCVGALDRIRSIIGALSQRAKESGSQQLGNVERELIELTINAGREAWGEYQKTGSKIALMFANEALEIGYSYATSASTAFDNDILNFVALDIYRAGREMQRKGFSPAIDYNEIFKVALSDATAPYQSWLAMQEMLTQGGEHEGALIATAFAIKQAPEDKFPQLARDYLYLSSRADLTGEAVSFSGLEEWYEVKSKDELDKYIGSDQFVPVQLLTHFESCDLQVNNLAECSSPSSRSVTETIDKSEGAAVIRGLNMARKDLIEISELDRNSLKSAVMRASERIRDGNR